MLEDPCSDRFERRLRAGFAGDRSHLDLRHSARDDAAEERQLGRDVEREAVGRPPAREVTPDRRILVSGRVIELGRGSEDEVLARAERFASTLTQMTSRYQRGLEFADLRHNEGYALRLKGISTGAAAAAAAAKTGKR